MQAATITCTEALDADPAPIRCLGTTTAYASISVPNPLQHVCWVRQHSTPPLLSHDRALPMGIAPALPTRSKSCTAALAGVQGRSFNINFAKNPLRKLGAEMFPSDPLSSRQDGQE